MLTAIKPLFYHKSFEQVENSQAVIPRHRQQCKEVPSHHPGEARNEQDVKSDEIDPDKFSNPRPQPHEARDLSAVKAT